MNVSDRTRLLHALDSADLVLIGASNGLDMAEGLNIFAWDDHFREAYGDLANACGARCILQGLLTPWPDRTLAEAWQARYAATEWLGYEPTPLMAKLRDLTEGRDCFVLTCNTDGHFARAGFSEEHLLETEGSARKMVCSRGCCDDRLNARAAALAASDEAPWPRCPRCGAPLRLAIDEQRLAHPDPTCIDRLTEFRHLVEKHRGGNIVVLELGVGRNNGIIKALIQQAVGAEPNLTYAIFNYREADVPPFMADRCIVVEGDMARAFDALPLPRGTSKRKGAR